MTAASTVRRSRPVSGLPCPTCDAAAGEPCHGPRGRPGPNRPSTPNQRLHDTRVPGGAVIYRGPSRFDGSPIAVVLTQLRGITATSNRKLGDVVQAWILTEEEPRTSIKAGREGSVCGTCPLRPSTAKGGGGSICYVHWRWGPQAVWYTLNVRKTYQEGLDPRAIGGRVLRAGAWGDPAAVPPEVWEPYRAAARSTIGYTHAWRDLEASNWGWLMASVESFDDLHAAQAGGWRTFRVIPRLDEDAVPMRHEILCPASKERGRRTHCERCRLCDGTTRGPRRSIAIYEHGANIGRRNAKPGRTS